MRKEFHLFPASLTVHESALIIASELQNVRVEEAWLHQWQARIDTQWPEIEGALRHRAAMQIMLEGERAIVLLPLLLAQASNCKRHVLCSDNVYLAAADWQQLEQFYQQSGLHSKALDAVFACLRQHWPLALPGVHRLDAEDGSYSVTLGLGEPAFMQQQWLCSIDVFVRDESGQQRQWPWVLRYAAADCFFVMRPELLAREDFKEAARKAGMQLVGARGRRAHLQGQPPTLNQQRCMAIVGGGIAGAGIAMVMQQRGWEVTVFDPGFAESNAAKHRHHIAAAMTPFISVDDNHKSRLSRNALLRALHHWRDFPDEVILSRRGNVEINRDKGYGKDISLAVESLGFPEAWVRRLAPAEVSALLGFDLAEEGVFWSQARIISPENLLRHIYKSFDLRQCSARVVSVKKCAAAGVWTLYDEAEQALGEFEQVVLANAADCLAILDKSQLLQRANASGELKAAMPKITSTLHWMGGEVMHVAATRLKQVPHVGLGGQGYFLPATADGLCVLGSTYRHGLRDPGLSHEGQAVIKAKIPVDLSELELSAQPEAGWSGGRAVVQGRLPVICELDYAKGLWLAVAYGSHGLTWSCFAGDLIGAALDGEPIPLEKELYKAIGLR